VLAAQCTLDSMEYKIRFQTGVSSTDPDQTSVLVVGQLKHLKEVDFNLVQPKFGSKVDQQCWLTGLSRLNSSSLDTVPLYFNAITVAALPAKVSRHNTSSRAHSIAKTIKSSLSAAQNILIVCERRDVYASGCAVGRCFPLYNMKTGEPPLTNSDINVEFLILEAGGEVVSLETDEERVLLEESCKAIQLTAKIVDMPANEMTSDSFVAEVLQAEAELKHYGVTATIIQGEDLREQGFGGIYGVGKAAVHPPALAVLHYNPPGAQRSIAWVGKGIIYDTGGLSIKTKTAMPGMKRDCGGAAAVLGAFIVAVKAGFKDNLYGVMCIAENSVGPIATRPDDVHTLYSGKTVEINNTDAEGRLVLADGVVYASRDLKADYILDICTLTGAQGIATGRNHASHISNTEEWEQKISEAGRMSGDLSFPAIYCPEFHFPEFKSAVADMKNSVADRNNAQPSCAGIFIKAHLGFDFPGVWMHVDMAAPANVGERATGYGVSLLNCLFADSSSSPMLQQLAPSAPVTNGSTSQSTDPKKMRLE